MKRKRYSEEQIISILKEHEAGASVQELACRHGVCGNTIYRWKAKFGGMAVSEARRLRDLENGWTDRCRKRWFAIAGLSLQARPCSSGRETPA